MDTILEMLFDVTLLIAGYLMGVQSGYALRGIAEQRKGKLNRH